MGSLRWVDTVFFSSFFFLSNPTKNVKGLTFFAKLVLTIKGVGSFCSTKSLFNTSSGMSVGVIEVEPWAEGVCSNEKRGIVTEGPGRVVCRAVVGGTGYSLSLTASMLV